MAAASYSFLEVAVLDEVRRRFAGGDALVILTTDLDEIIWANGAGAALFGYPHVMAAIGAPSRLSTATRRQVTSTAGFPVIGRDRPLLVPVSAGLSSQPARLLASEITLPDGEAALLLAAPAAGRGGNAAETDRRAVGGFGDGGHFVAFVDEEGGVEASSEGFEALGIDADSLRSLASGLAEGSIARRLIGGAGRELPAGMARLTARSFLVVVIDEAAAGKGEDVRKGAEAPGDDAGVTAENAGAAADRIPASGPPDTPHADAEAAKRPAPDAAPGIDRTLPPVRFVWRTDAEGRFIQISREFPAVVGEAAADVVGRKFRDVAEALGLDPGGEIAGLLARRDTWSGRSVLWPVAGTRLRVPVDLAALPIYDRDRNFEGFRGFGVARAGDAVIEPAAPGRAVATPAPGSAEVPAPRSPGQPPEPAQDEAPPLRPHPEQRVDPKVIRLAEHRPPAGEKGLSSGERIAFQQIAERLKRESALDAGVPPAGRSAAAGVRPGAPAHERRPGGKAEVPEARLRGPARPPAGIGAPGTGPAEARSSGRSTGAESEPHRAGFAARGGERTQATAAGAGGPPTEGAGHSATGSDRRRGNEKAAPARPARWGLSLLDFARWDRGRKRARPPEGGGGEAASEFVQRGEAPAPHAAGPARAGVAPDRPRRPNERRAPSDSGAAALPPDAHRTGADDGRRTGPAPRREAAGSGSTQQAAPALGAGTVPSAGAADRADGPPAAVSGDAAAPGKGPGAAATPADATPSFRAEPRRSHTAILDRLPVPVLVHSGDSLHYANAEFLELTGYESLSELAAAGGIGALFAGRYDGDEGTPGDRQLRLRRSDGEEFPVKAVLRSLPWNGGKALILVLARSREPGAPGGQLPLAAGLEARVAEMRTIIDTATDGVVLISPEGTIRSISRPAEALFGFDSDEVAGKPFASLFAIESQRSARDYLKGLSDHGVASVLNDGREVIGREAEGRFIPLFMTIGRLPADSGYCAVVRDITQWKRAEEELTQARAVAERASAHKSDFLARISHEIRTPLNAIIGFSELMIDEKFGPVANARYRDYLRDINRSGNHVLDLVNDLLDISKIEAGQQEMSYEAVSLNDTLAEAVALMQPQANRERVIIRSSFASKLPEVVADLRSVRQIALNVLSNAVRYTQAGGQVIVSTAYEANGEVAMRVRDTGIGMTQAEIEQALKPFKQISSLKRARGDGTGLGLPLTKAMVEANRAKFSISSAPGEGTLVEISFPSTRVLAG